MLSFDSTTLAAYRAASTPQGKAQAVSDSLGSGTLTVELRDGATLMYSGDFAGPLVVGADGSLSRDVVPTGLALVAGTANASTWICRIRNAAGTRTMTGPIGAGSGHFTLAAPLVVGQGVRLRINITAAGATSIFPLAVHSGGRYLVDATGSPFLVHGDTPWSLAVQCTQAQVDTYLDDRQSKGFTAVLFNAIEHRFSSQTPKWRNAGGNDPFNTTATDACVWTSPVEAYWSLVDHIVAGARARGMACFIAPAYLGYNGGSGSDTDEGWNGAVVNANAGDLQSYGAWLASRYAGYGNVVWVMGGDYAGTSGAGGEREKQWNIVTGIRSVAPDAVITGHSSPTGEAYSYWNGYAGFNLNNIYSDQTQYDLAATAYGRAGPLPLFLIEGSYDSGSNAQRCRQQAWTTVLAGGCGHFFGNTVLWGLGEPIYCGGGGAASALASYLTTTATTQMGHFKSLMDAVAWHLLQPKTGTELVTTSLSSGSSRVCPALASDASFGLVWVPTATSPTINLAALAGPNVLCRWYDPTAGTYTAIGTYAASGTQSMTHPGNNAAGASDWVLRLDSVA